ncbi:hypothetical protein [Microcystis phage MaeS]|nr:hypothetical protein [Microcystis phage MaeS]
MGGKVHQTEEEKFQQSLKSWGDDVDNRPFIRVKENVERDIFDYRRKRQRIHEEKLQISKVTNDPVERINLIDAWGHEYSKGGYIREFSIQEDRDK